jgi:type IV pilus assembly protein PilA
MGTTWRDAFRRVGTALARRRNADGEDPDLTDESGFTLIELMVVLVIMGILMAIAIPTFLGVTSTANDTSTQSNLANVITAAKAIYARSDSYPKTLTLAKALKADEPEFTYLTSAGTAALTESTKQTAIAVRSTATGTSNKFVAVAYMTKTSECWVAVNTASTGQVHYGYIQIGLTNGGLADTACLSATPTAAKGGTTPTATVKWGSGNKWPTAPTGH